MEGSGPQQIVDKGYSCFYYPEGLHHVPAYAFIKDFLPIDRTGKAGILQATVKYQESLSNFASGHAGPSRKPDSNACHENS